VTTPPTHCGKRSDRGRRRRRSRCRRCWTPRRARAMAPFLPQIVPRLRARGELDLDESTAVRLRAVSVATIDRRLAGEPKRLQLKGRSGTKPGSLLGAPPACGGSLRSRSGPGPTGKRSRRGSPEIVITGRSRGRRLPARSSPKPSLSQTFSPTGPKRRRAEQGPEMGHRGPGRPALRLPVPGAGHRLRQRQRVHQRPPAGLTRAGADHLHPLARGRKNDGAVRGAEELIGRASRGRLSPLRNPARAGVAQRHPRPAATADELLSHPNRSWSPSTATARR
jgi:hypothetical protein